jgi:hypothetical protein
MEQTAAEVGSRAVSIVAEYWAGVLQRLDAEVHVFARLIAHEGERGRENEAVLARILEALVPRRYGIGSGLLFDTAGAYSRQTDIVVFEQSDEPAVLAQTTQVLFPIESVLACIEVKTTLRGEDVTDCLKKARDMRKLTVARKHADGSEHPLFVVLAYRAGQTPQTIMQKFLEAEEYERPDLVCVVEQAVLAGADQTIRDGSDAPIDAGIALLHTEDRQPVEGTPTGPDLRQRYEGREHSMVAIDGRHLLVDRSGALLLFAEALVRRLAQKQDRSTPVISYYVTAEMRELAWHELGDDDADEGEKTPSH